MARSQQIYRPGTTACNSCISCKMTIFACILRAVKIGLYFEKFIQIPLKVALILEKSRLYFRDDLPVIPVFFQLECRATPGFKIPMFIYLISFSVH